MIRLSCLPVSFWSHVKQCREQGQGHEAQGQGLRGPRTRTRTCKLVLEDPRGQGLSSRTTDVKCFGIVWWLINWLCIPWSWTPRTKTYDILGLIPETCVYFIECPCDLQCKVCVSGARIYSLGLYCFEHTANCEWWVRRTKRTPARTLTWGFICAKQNWWSVWCC